jgi:hypothetical protein
VREILLLGGKSGGGGGGDSFEGPAARSRPADKAKKGGGEFEEFPGALDAEDDDLPF